MTPSPSPPRCGDAGGDTGLKAFRDGTHRIVPPSETLARVTPLLAAAGITRLAVLTGLDTIGIPVAAAYRPNSRSVSVHQGKGVSEEAALASAAMEALETFHAETIDQPLRLARHDELASRTLVLDPATLPRSRQGGDIAQRMLWLEGVDLLSKQAFWTPYELASMDLTLPQPPGFGVFQATTNGLASGNSWEEALVHAICEVVERDAVALAEAGRQAFHPSRAVRLESVGGSASGGMLERLHRAGMLTAIWDLTSDIGLAVFACLLLAADENDGVQPEMGYGCHPDRDVALSRALSEAAQSRLTIISGARDDLDDADYRPHRIAITREAALGLMRGRPQRHWTDTPSRAAETVGADLALVLSCLRRAGCRQVVAIDLTRPDFAVPVARVIIPGLEGPWTGPQGEYVQGPRARAAATTAAA